MAPLLGCIADDLTGATDLASMLVRGGMSVVQTVGVPEGPVDVHNASAVVVSLKSRNIDPDEAIGQSLAAIGWLRSLGAKRFFFKYCSTFDSTDQGNIGPVASALAAELAVRITVACPAFPENGRTVYQGHLFVGDRLLSESGMEHHPITPMTDADLVRVLGRQTSDRVGLVPVQTVTAGRDAIRQRLSELSELGCKIAIVDTITEEHLAAIADACRDLILLTGGSGIAVRLPAAYHAMGLIGSPRFTPAWPQVEGQEAVLSGSCSRQTLRQIEHFESHWPGFVLTPDRLCDTEETVKQISRWAAARLRQGPVLVYSSAPPEAVMAVQNQFGRRAAGRLVEETLAAISVKLVSMGVRRLVVAGGETSGAVLQALQVKALKIGPQIEPGIPWTESVGVPRLALALKSGNFGSDDFFERALEILP